MAFNFFRSQLILGGQNVDLEPSVPQEKRFLDLPPETILCVADYLPVPFTACLALCNRALGQLLGSRFWSSLHSQEDKASFLSTLAKDLPQYFLCHICVRLHRKSSVQWPRSVPHREPLPCLLDDERFSLTGSDYIFQFAHIQLAMMQQHYGLEYGIPLEAFSHTEVHIHDRLKTTKLLSVEAQIVSNEFLMRSQMWTLVPSHRREEFFSKGLIRYLCEHIRSAGAWSRSNLLPCLIRCKLDHLNDTGNEALCSFCGATLRCEFCEMDFQIDVREFASKDTAIFITRWVNFGSGITPKDPKWRRHLRIIGDHFGALRQLSPAFNTRTSFESQEGQSYLALTEDNSAKLFSKREYKLETIGHDGFVWRWHLGDSWWHLEPSPTGVVASWGKVINSWLDDSFQSKFRREHLEDAAIDATVRAVADVLKKSRFTLAFPRVNRSVSNDEDVGDSQIPN